jgi:hypothetical protein
MKVLFGAIAYQTTRSVPESWEERYFEVRCSKCKDRLLFVFTLQPSGHASDYQMPVAVRWKCFIDSKAAPVPVVAAG